MKRLCKILYRLIPVVIAVLPFVVSARTYYVSAYGSDIGDGTQGNPFGTLDYACARLQDSDILYITSDMNGTIYLAGKSGITISGFNGLRNITSGTKGGLLSDNSKGITITDLAFWGTKGDAYQDGLAFWFAHEVEGGNITVNNVYVSGYGGHGIGVYNYQEREINNISISYANIRNCKWNGIGIWDGGYGATVNNSFKNIIGVKISHCIVQEISGGAVNWMHTGSGIWVGNAKNVVIENCEAAYNGAKNSAQGSGPVGIWIGSVDTALICNNSSHENSSNQWDGGGYDVDGNCSEVVVQDCESYGNKGPGFMVYHYTNPWGANTSNVTVKNCKSTGDAINSLLYGAFFIGGNLSDVSFLNNTINQEQGYVIRAAGGDYKNVTITGNNICYNVPAQFSNFGTQPTGVTIQSNTFPCIVLSLDTTRPYQRPVGFPSSYYLITYPNPASGSINAVMNAPRGHYRIEVYNSFGMLMEKSPLAITGKKTITLSLKKYAAGVYIIMLIDEYGIEAKQKFIKL